MPVIRASCLNPAPWSHNPFMILFRCFFSKFWTSITLPMPYCYLSTDQSSLVYHCRTLERENRLRDFQSKSVALQSLICSALRGRYLYRFSSVSVWPYIPQENCLTMAKIQTYSDKTKLITKNDYKNRPRDFYTLELPTWSHCKITCDGIMNV